MGKLDSDGPFMKPPKSSVFVGGNVTWRLAKCWKLTRFFGIISICLLQDVSVWGDKNGIYVLPCVDKLLIFSYITKVL